MARAEAAEERAWQLENSSADLARKLEEAGAKERSMQQVGGKATLSGGGAHGVHCMQQCAGIAGRLKNAVGM